MSANGNSAAAAVPGAARLPWAATAHAVGAIAMFVAMAVCIRALANRLPAGDIAFYRAFFGLLLLLPLVLGGGWARARRTLATKRLPLFALRALFTYLAIASYFYALTKIPMAEAISLSTTLPIFMTALAALVLGEKVGARRWTAVGIGFVGALIIVRPGIASVSWAALTALASASLYAAAGIVVKMLARSEPPGRIVFYMNLLVALLAAAPVLADFTPPRWADFPLILAIGATGTAAHFFQSNALKRADASFVAPFDFLRLPLGAVCGYLIFDDHPSDWVWVGAALIFAGTLWIARRETARKLQPQPSS
ncbi:MAG TPA: DMT family transporter [Alphaproteobacteria bacterium]|jgi:drug/metabolite transporter (DMT)-like permease